MLFFCCFCGCGGDRGDGVGGGDGGSDCGGGGGGGDGCDDRCVVVNCLVDFTVNGVSLVKRKTGEF